MASNNKYCIKVPFYTITRNGFAYYFIEDGKTIYKTMSWDVDEIRMDKKFSEIWEVEGKRSSIKGAYTLSIFNESPMKFLYNGDKLVFNTIFNSPKNDDCLKGKFKLKNDPKEVISPLEFQQVSIIEYLGIDDEFKNLFFLYNKTLISSEKTKALFDSESELFFQVSRKEIMEKCKGNDPTRLKK